MLSLLQTFVDIALWRKGPQDLPASRFLAWSTLLVYVTTCFIQLFYLRMSVAVAIIAVQVGMLLAWLWVVLAFFERRERFVQTVTAVLGVSTLIALIDIVVRSFQLALAGPAFQPSPLVSYLRFLAYALAVGRIFMHALERGLFTGIALTVAIAYSTLAVAQLALNKIQVGP